MRVYESQKEKSMHCLSVLRGARRRRRRNAVVARAWVGKSREEAAAASLAASRSLLRQVCNLSFLLCSGRAHCLQAQTDSYMLTHSFIHSFIRVSVHSDIFRAYTTLSLYGVRELCLRYAQTRTRLRIYIYIHRSSWNRFFGGLLRCTWTRKWLCEHELTTIAYLHNSIGHG